MNIDVRIKFRAFGVTFGTAKASFPAAALLSLILRQLGLKVTLAEALSKLSPETIYDDHGLTVELVAL